MSRRSTTLYFTSRYCRLGKHQNCDMVWFGFGYKSREKVHEEIIGRRHVVYTLSPNGTVEIAVRSNDCPFRLANDEDENIIFSFLGQLRDRLLYHVNDIRERYIPPIMQWILKQCDLNKDIEISDKAQPTFPDIQLKYADRVFRLYVKILEDKAFCRGEESLLKLNQILPEALDNIRHPYKSIESKIDKLSKQLKQFIDLLTGISKRLEKLEINTSGINQDCNRGSKFLQLACIKK
jgi:hypothetical protein